MIVVDASALVAIGDFEDDAEDFADAISRASAAVISPVNAVEAGLILIGRRRFADIGDFNRWLSKLAVEVASDPVDHSGALAAYMSFGRNYHRARLNFADCFAYALAKQMDAPLLYKGDDFAMTDVRSALG
ncbi:type II toxin-antitoxin system VapC family toxin [Caulobacter sp. BK020]|uniref:type II toxin-antitoxin system VapC family toxin n=1 Tax=Caulobacter sp. BK020 TaxID=2512117 RepID=UPI001051E4EE|nr:type II toxin-antitoxin system VapC family toxin [Caulobacter sp. BK020]TCS18105.1 ribonuclease VapC [Caulobacter sp. BK020]